MHRAIWLVALVWCLGTIRASDGGPEEIHIAHLERANAEQDCRRAISHGDLRFLAVYGFTVETPGVRDRDEHLRRARGIKIIAGTSDAGDMAFNDRAEAYAERYNRCLLEHLTRKHAKRSNDARGRVISQVKGT